MKLSNAVVGMKVQVKKDCTGFNGGCTPKGLVAEVGLIKGDEYELRLDHESLDDGYEWVNASDVRKYREPLQVGDTVLVGSKGAGYGLVIKGYAGKVCTVASTGKYPDAVEIAHPDVHDGAAYLSRVKYLTKVEPEEVKEPARPEVGDYVVATDFNSNLVEGVAYRVIGYSSITQRVGIALLTHPESLWKRRYYIDAEAYSTILRGVTDNEGVTS